MGIIRAFGLGLFLIILASLMPSVFAQLSSTAVAFLESSTQAFTAAGILASHASLSLPTSRLTPPQFIPAP